MPELLQHSRSLLRQPRYQLNIHTGYDIYQEFTKFIASRNEAAKKLMKKEYDDMRKELDKMTSSGKFTTTEIKTRHKELEALLTPLVTHTQRSVFEEAVILLMSKEKANAK